jgi:hypothetical protein
MPYKVIDIQFFEIKRSVRTMKNRGLYNAQVLAIIPKALAIVKEALAALEEALAIVK